MFSFPFHVFFLLSERQQNFLLQLPPQKKSKPPGFASNNFSLSLSAAAQLFPLEHPGHHTPGAGKLPGLSTSRGQCFVISPRCVFPGSGAVQAKQEVKEYWLLLPACIFNARTEAI